MAFLTGMARCFFVSVVAGVLSVDVFAGTTFVWTGTAGDNDWTNKDNYEGGVSAPGVGDVVILPANAQVFLSQTDVASCALVSSLLAVKSEANTGVRLTIDVPADQMLSLNCALTTTGTSYQDASWRNFDIFKTGDGRLELNSASQFIANDKVNYSVDYYVNWQVMAGTLRFPQTYSGSGYGHNGVLTVAEGATCVLGAGGGNGTVFRGISGLGTITAESKTAQWLRVDSKDAPGPFAGRIVGNVKYDSRGYVRLTGVESTMVGPIFRVEYLKGEKDSLNSGNTYVAKIGQSFEPSSIGFCSNIVFYNFGAKLHYTGTGETTDKSIGVQFASVDAPHHYSLFDAGPYGGLTLAGPLKMTNYERMHMFYLSGDNAQPCALTGPIVNYETGTFHMFKEGTGTWNIFHHPQTTLSGAFSVLAGTLGFDSVAAKGTSSALGSATCTQLPYHGVYQEASNVTWAVKLGGGRAAARANLVYIGSTNCLAMGRPIALNGTGALLNNGTGRLAWQGVTVLDGVGDATLILGGTNGRENVLDDVSDGTDGKLSLVKEGTGLWRLGANCTFSGTLDVQGGKLLVGAPSQWNYYRWVIKATFNTTTEHSAERVVGLKALCLYDAEGHDRVHGLSQEGDWSIETSTYYRSLPYSFSAYFGGVREALDIAEGHVRLTRYSGDYLDVTLTNNDLTYIFAHPLSGATPNIFARSRPMDPPLVDETNSWFVLTFRPVAGAPITSWDFVNDYYSKDYQMISNCTLEASLDGVNWTELDAIVNHAKPTRNTWQSNGLSYEGGDTCEGRSGRPIAPGPMVSSNWGMSAVTVASGAELEVVGGESVTVPKIVVPTTGMGTVRGLKLAEGGVIDVVGQVSSGVPLTIAADFSHIDLPADYALTVNGGAHSARPKLSADSQSITLLPLGTIIYLR